MHNSGIYSINTEASGKLTVANIGERHVCKSYTDLDIVKMEEQAAFGEKS